MKELKAFELPFVRGFGVTSIVMKPWYLSRTFLYKSHSVNKLNQIDSQHELKRILKLLILLIWLLFLKLKASHGQQIIGILWMKEQMVSWLNLPRVATLHLSAVRQMPGFPEWESTQSSCSSKLKVLGSVGIKKQFYEMFYVFI